MLEWYRSLIALRRSEPDLSDPRLDRVAVSCSASHRWVVVTRGSFRVVCNLSPDLQTVALDTPVTEVILTSAPAVSPADHAIALPGHSVAVVRVARS